MKIIQALGNHEIVLAISEAQDFMPNDPQSACLQCLANLMEHRVRIGYGMVYYGPSFSRPRTDGVAKS